MATALSLYCEPDVATQNEDKYKEERQRLYNEYFESVEEVRKQEEEEIEEKKRILAEKIANVEETKQQLLEEAHELETQGDQAIQEQMQFIDEHAGEASGPLYDELRDIFQSHYAEGLQWPSDEASECTQEVQKNREELQMKIEEASKAYLDQLTSDIEREQAELDEMFTFRDQQIQAEIDQILAENDQVMESEIDPEDKEKLRRENEENLQCLNEAAEKNLQEYQQTWQLKSEENEKKIQEARASNELFGGLAAGGNPFLSEEANQNFHERHDAILKNDHEQAIVSAKYHMTEKRGDRYSNHLQNLEEKQNILCRQDFTHREQVMRHQINSQPDEETRQKVVKSVHEEIDNELAQVESELASSERQYIDDTYSLARERKAVKKQGERNDECLKKRRERYNQVRSEVESPVPDSQPNRKKMLELERDDLVGSIRETDELIRQNEQETKQKADELNEQHKSVRQSYLDKKKDLEEKVAELQKLKSEMLIETSTDQAMSDLSTSIDSISITEDAAVTEINKELAQVESELESSKRQYNDTTYSLSRERKAVKKQGELNEECLKKRRERYNQVLSEVDAPVPPSKKNQKKMEPDRDYLVASIRETDELIRQNEQETKQKADELNEQHTSVRQSYLDKKKELEEKIAELQKRKSEMMKETSTDQPMSNLMTADEPTSITEDALVKSQEAVYNTPAIRDVKRLTSEHLNCLKEMKERGEVSSLDKKNRIKHGDTHAYEVKDVKQLYDTDYGLWENVSHGKTTGNSQTGPGERRQWSAKGNADMQKIAAHYPEQDLGVVRYHSKQESSKYGSKMPRETQQQSEVSSSKTKPRQRSASPTVATPIRQAHDGMVVDDYHLKKLTKEATEEQVQDPANNKIEEPTGGDLYLYKLSGRQNEAEAVKEDGLRWKKGNPYTTPNYSKDVYYARDSDEVTSKFQKHVYTANDGKHMMVHYVGDASYCVPKKRRLSRPEVKP